MPEKERKERVEPIRGRVFFFSCRTENDEGVKLMTEEVIKDAIRDLQPTEWAYILHDKDVYTEADEKKVPEHKAGMHKPNHYHVVVLFDSRVALPKVAKAFGLDDHMIDKGKNQKSGIYMMLYLIHRRDGDKYQYADSEVVANFDYAKAVGRWEHELGLGSIEEVIEDIYKKGLRVKDVIEEHGYAFYNKYRKRIEQARADYLKDAPVGPFRLNFFIEGKGGIGKSVLSRALARSFADADLSDEDAYFEVKGDLRTAFEGYDGQQIVIWDDKRAIDLVKAFGRSNVLNLFDTHPGERSSRQNVKYGTSYLSNSINIVNGIESFTDFLDGIAGEYKDAQGVLHSQEDKSQSYRRFPLIICLHEKDFDLMMNRGFFEGSREYLQYFQYANIRGNFGELVRNCPPDALVDAQNRMIEPIKDAARQAIAVDAENRAEPQPELFEPESKPFDSYGEVTIKEKPRRKKKAGNL